MGVPGPSPGAGAPTPGELLQAYAQNYGAVASPGAGAGITTPAGTTGGVGLPSISSLMRLPMGTLLQLLQGLGGQPGGIPPAIQGRGAPSGMTPLPVIPPQGGGMPPAIPQTAPGQAPTPAIPPAQQTFSVSDIQKYYTDPVKLSDVPRALRGIEGPITLDKLQGLNPGWMTERSKEAWRSALDALGQGHTGVGGSIPAYGPGSPYPQPTPPAPWTPTPGTLTAPWVNLLGSDPIMGMMMVNALGGGQVGTQGLFQMLSGKGGNQTQMPGMMPGQR